jgi:hypothetical protein
MSLTFGDRMRVSFDVWPIRANCSVARSPRHAFHLAIGADRSSNWRFLSRSLEGQLLAHRCPRHLARHVGGGTGGERVGAVLARLKPRRPRAGEAVFRRGDAAHSMFVVERGSVSAVSPLAVANRTLR